MRTYGMCVVCVLKEIKYMWQNIFKMMDLGKGYMGVLCIILATCL